MKPGSVLLFHRSTSWSQLRRDFKGTLFTALIHLCTRSRWNHAALAVSRNEYVEATAGGVCITTMGPANMDEILLVPVEYKDDDDRDDVLRWATARLGTRYGYMNAFICGLRNLFPGIQIKDGETIICSELVAEALERAGGIRSGLTGQLVEINKDSGLVSPGDLAEALGVPRA